MRLLIVGIVLAVVAWLIPVLVGSPHPHKEIDASAVVLWLVAWPFVYGVVAATVFAFRRFLDSRFCAPVFGSPEGPAPRWVHLTMQCVLFTGPPVSILGSFVSVLLGDGSGIIRL